MYVIFLLASLTKRSGSSWGQSGRPSALCACSSPPSLRPWAGVTFCPNWRGGKRRTNSFNFSSTHTRSSATSRGMDGQGWMILCVCVCGGGCLSLFFYPFLVLVRPRRIKSSVDFCYVSCWDAEHADMLTCIAVDWVKEERSRTFSRFFFSCGLSRHPFFFSWQWFVTAPYFFLVDICHGTMFSFSWRLFVTAPCFFLDDCLSRHHFFLFLRFSVTAYIYIYASHCLMLTMRWTDWHMQCLMFVRLYIPGSDSSPPYRSNWSVNLYGNWVFY